MAFWPCHLWSAPSLDPPSAPAEISSYKWIVTSTGSPSGTHPLCTGSATGNGSQRTRAGKRGRDDNLNCPSRSAPVIRGPRGWHASRATVTNSTQLFSDRRTYCADAEWLAAPAQPACVACGGVRGIPGVFRYTTDARDDGVEGRECPGVRWS